MIAGPPRRRVTSFQRSSSAPSPDAAPDELRRVLQRNAWFVLELEPGATRGEVERAARRCLDALSLELEGATHYPTPFGPCPRDVKAVRSARNQLRELGGRADAELWWIIATQLADETTSPRSVPAI